LPQCVYVVICPPGLCTVHWRAHTLMGIPRKLGIGAWPAGAALLLKVQGPCTSPPSHCRFFSTTAVASCPETPRPRPSPHWSCTLATLVRMDQWSGIWQPGHRQSLGATTHMRAHAPLTWSRGDNSIRRPSGRRIHPGTTHLDIAPHVSRTLRL